MIISTEEIRAVLQEAAFLDHEWLASPAGRDDPACTPWMPFPLFDFIALVAEALPDSTGNRFLEIGSGIGTRMKVASAIYGLDAHGFDRVPEYVAKATELGLSAEVADAATYDGYGNYDILWFNRVFGDRALQRKLELKVWQDMAPGAVVICANLEFPPPLAWWPILDDREVRRWIVQKPGPQQ